MCLHTCMQWHQGLLHVHLPHYHYQQGKTHYFTSPNQSQCPLLCGNGTHFCMGASVGGDRSSALLRTHAHLQIMSTTVQWRIQINNRCTVEDCSVQPHYLQRTMLCQDQCGRGELAPLCHPSRISCSNSSRKLLVKNSEKEKLILHLRRLRKCRLYTHPWRSIAQFAHNLLTILLRMDFKTVVRLF